MPKSKQPYFQMFLNGVDITEDVHGAITFEEKENLMVSLNFGLQRGLSYLSAINVQRTTVEFWGGTVDPDNQRQFFKGHVTYVRSEFQDNGLVIARFECHASGKGGKMANREVYYYPGKESLRGWATSSPIKASEIIRSIVEVEMGAKFGKIDEKEALMLADDPEFTHTRPVKQNYESNWAFILKFCKNLNTSVWESLNEDGENEIFVVGKDLLRTSISDLAFVYIGQDGETYTLKNQSGSKFSVQELEPNQIQLLTISIDEDSDAAHGILRTRMKVSEGDDTYDYLFAIYDEEDQQYYYYELDEEAVAREPVEVQDRIHRVVLNEDEYEFEDVLKYFKRIHKDHQADSKDYSVMGRPLIGAFADISFEGNVNIKAHYSYPIYGISKRYSSTSEGKGTWQMISLTHTWDQSGYICNARMVRDVGR